MKSPLSTFVRLLLPALLPVLALSCMSRERTVITVTGEIPASQMGATLPHEHALVDFVPYDSIAPGRWDRDTVVAKLHPYFAELKKHKISTFVEATPEFLGRDPQMLALLSEKSGIRILTNTGWYAADKERHLPADFDALTAEEISRHWIGEARNGIGNTGIRPGFIKIGINNKVLSARDRKLVEAACLTHQATGLAIMSHTGPGEPALAQLKMLADRGISGHAFIWTHAYRESSEAVFMEIYRTGAWIALDAIRAGKSADHILEVLKMLKNHGALDRVLLSHDAGWYDPAKPGGGTIRPYTDLFEVLLPALRKEGFTDADFEQMMVKNPAAAFARKD